MTRRESRGEQQAEIGGEKWLAYQMDCGAVVDRGLPPDGGILTARRERGTGGLAPERVERETPAGDLTESAGSGYPIENLSEWGFSMKGIRPEGKCPKCKRPFQFDKSKGFICKTHLTKPDRFRISVFYEGERIFRCTDLEGRTLRTFGDAYALLRQAEKEKDGHKFDRDKWKSKVKVDYSFTRLIDAWYQDKEEEMKKGHLAPGYVPKLRTYIEHYYRPVFGDDDVREIRSLKAFIKQLPDRLSAKYQKNITDALINFFKTLKEDGVIEDVPKTKKIEVPEYEPTPISRDTQARILDQIPAEHRPIFTFLFNQGVRPSEARALKWRDIEGDTVTIRRTWSGEVLREQTKNKRVRHNLLFDATLKALPQRRFPEDFVFTHGKAVRRHYSHNYLSKIYNEACRTLGIAVELYEATKHSFGTQRINEGVPENVLREWFGHAKSEMTRRYAKLRVVDAFRQIEEKKKKVVELKAANDDRE
ncbi:MAG: site-specific integrase [Nitrospiraceae bacterium]|nr:site-specific integrase [Nitrospiraceae bacterium]